VRVQGWRGRPPIWRYPAGGRCRPHLGSDPVNARDGASNPGIAAKLIRAPKAATPGSSCAENNGIRRSAPHHLDDGGIHGHASPTLHHDETYMTTTERRLSPGAS